ncbi:hypothetical protein ETB97_006731 [Aspergillus alliaceus]|uniref:Uncharacterized protein n=1 Tax=Petromyces alliaceus TaxID=209559 RepID=A0A8H6E255_PETAA|nr:hypothetical protein ETB97_006731 [Aspergillus burnettii]
MVTLDWHKLQRNTPIRVLRRWLPPELRIKLPLVGWVKHPQLPVAISTKPPSRPQMGTGALAIMQVKLLSSGHSLVRAPLLAIVGTMADSDLAVGVPTFESLDAVVL